MKKYEYEFKNFELCRYKRRTLAIAPQSLRARLHSHKLQKRDAQLCKQAMHLFL